MNEFKNYLGKINNCKIDQGYFDVVYYNCNINLEKEIISTVYVKLIDSTMINDDQDIITTYIMMQDQILKDHNGVCFLIELTDEKSLNIPWEITVNNLKYSHSKIRKINFDKLVMLLT